MKDEEINMAIAEACGWEEIEAIGQRRPRGFPPIPHNPLQRVFIPKYATDLNAMHEAENWLVEQPEHTYSNVSYQVYDAYLIEKHGPRATARQRAEAFLRPIGKWKEGE